MGAGVFIPSIYIGNRSLYYCMRVGGRDGDDQRTARGGGGARGS
jgi:hypothetical protein